VKPDIASIKARLAKITPGPWWIGNISNHGADRDNDTIECRCPTSDSELKSWPICEMYGGVSTGKDAEFIAHAPEDITHLLTYVGELEQRHAMKTPMNESYIAELESRIAKLRLALEWYAKGRPFRDDVGNEEQLAHQALKDDGGGSCPRPQEEVGMDKKIIRGRFMYILVSLRKQIRFIEASIHFLDTEDDEKLVDLEEALDEMDRDENLGCAICNKPIGHEQMHCCGACAVKYRKRSDTDKSIKGSNEP